MKARGAVDRSLERFLDWIEAQMTVVDPDLLSRPEDVSRLRESLDRKLAEVERIAAQHARSEPEEVARLRGSLDRKLAEVDRIAAQHVPSDVHARRAQAALDALVEGLDTEAVRLENDVAARIRADVEALLAQPTAERLERLERLLSLLEREAASLRKLGDQERDEAIAWMQRAEDAVRQNSSPAAMDALATYGGHAAESQRLVADAEQLDWMVATYRQTVASARSSRQPS